MKIICSAILLSTILLFSYWLCQINKRLDVSPLTKLAILLNIPLLFLSALSIAWTPVSFVLICYGLCLAYFALKLRPPETIRESQFLCEIQKQFEADKRRYDVAIFLARNKHILEVCPRKFDCRSMTGLPPKYCPNRNMIINCGEELKNTKNN